MSERRPYHDPRGNYWRRANQRARREHTSPTARDIWFWHKAKCPDCGRVDSKRPATVALACPEGVRYLKANLEERNV